MRTARMPGRRVARAFLLVLLAALWLMRRASNYMAAKAMEQAAGCAVVLRDASQASELYMRTSDLFVLNGTADRAAEILDKGAKSIETFDPNKAIALYSESCTLFEQEDRHRFAADTFKRAITLSLKNKQLSSAINFSQRLIDAYIKMANRNGVSKSVLSLIIIHLAHDDQVEASKLFERYVGEQQLASDELHLASDLLEAFTNNDEELLDKTVKCQAMSFLDNELVRLARGLKVEGIGAPSAVDTKQSPQSIPGFTHVPPIISSARSTSGKSQETLVPTYSKPVPALPVSENTPLLAPISPSFTSEATIATEPSRLPSLPQYHEPLYVPGLTQSSFTTPGLSIPGFTPLLVPGSTTTDALTPNQQVEEDEGFC